MSELPGWAWGLIALAVGGVGWFAWRWLTPVSTRLRRALAKHLGAKAEHVYVNLPPRPKRYPGALFSGAYGLIDAFGEPDDPRLKRGEKTEFRHGIDAAGDLHGSGSAAVFRVLASASDSVRLELAATALCVVEMATTDLTQRVAEHRKKHPALPDDLRVIVRALEGVFQYRVTRRKKVSGEAWGEIKKEVKAETEKPTSGLVVQGGAEADDATQITLGATAPDVIAYLAVAASQFPEPPPPGAASTPDQPLPPAPAGDFSRDVPGAVDRLLFHEPSKDDAFCQALEEIGPRAEVKAALEQLVGTGDPKSLRSPRARRLLEGPIEGVTFFPPPS